MMDSPGDYRFGGDLWNCKNPQRLAVLYGTAMGWTDVVPQGHLTSGTGINVSYTTADRTSQRIAMDRACRCGPGPAKPGDLCPMQYPDYRPAESSTPVMR